MPKIDVPAQAFARLLGETLDPETLEQRLVVAKGELDGIADDGATLRIELNDTNRPDLWSTAGLARQLRLGGGAAMPEWRFATAPASEDKTILVDASVRDVRPFVMGFRAYGRKIDDDSLRDLIQTQEKLCWNYGQKRKAIAMGIYRYSLISWPVHYTTRPGSFSFAPLGGDGEMSLDRIITDHPKGQEFGHIVADGPAKPMLLDNDGKVLSFPPIINSAVIGAVEIGDDDLFVEVTGTALEPLRLTCNIVACDLEDLGFTVEPVKAIYPEDTGHGTEIVVPARFQEAVRAEISAINTLLGTDWSGARMAEAARRMGPEVRISNDGIELLAEPAIYRNDYLHPVDLAEDVMMGAGMDSFEPQLPEDFTVGRLTPSEEASRHVRRILPGLGYQEMIFGYLGSADAYITRMRPDPAHESDLDRQIVRIDNPMSESYEFVRNSPLPSLLHSEASSGHAAYPHRMFEIGKVVRLDSDDPTGSRTWTTVGLSISDSTADFNELNSHIAALLYYLGVEHVLRASDDPRFLPGRRADIVVREQCVGVLGEIHPGVLENWGIGLPVVAGELILERCLEL